MAHNGDNQGILKRHPWLILLCYFPPIWLFGAGMRFGIEVVMSVLGIEPSFENVLKWPNELYRDLKQLR